MRVRARNARVVALVAFACALAHRVGSARAFYLPGVAPIDYERDDLVYIKVNKLTSTVTQLPYDYYALPYCKPDKIKHAAENLGEVLRGDRIENSLYSLEMRFDDRCKVQCRKELSEQEAKTLKGMIKDEYRVQMILDNLPVGMTRYVEDEQGRRKKYERGYPVGFTTTDGKAYVNNHIRFTILYHKDQETDLSRIVGFECEPFSVDHKYKKWSDDKPLLKTCDPRQQVYVSEGSAPQEVKPGEEIVYTYDTLFKESDIRWASRWDTYLLMADDEIHWFSIINSMMIVLFLSVMTALIMLRTLHRDITVYNQLETAEETQEESGWKLVHGDVFRVPAHYTWLSVFAGTGVQLICMTTVTIFFAVLGFLSPANRGGLMTAMVMLYVIMSFVNGYVSAFLFRMFKGQTWKMNAVKASLLYPGVVFMVGTVLNVLIWGQKSSGAIPFGTYFVLMFLWFGISVPLTFVGSYLGFKREPLEEPVRTNKIPRQIPPQPWYMHDAVAVLIGGVLPFGAVFIELFFILTSIWLQQFYYIFGFLALVFIILVVTCAEITVVMCYFQLCAEDYRWWWRSFLTSGAAAFYMFAYGIVYYHITLTVTHKLTTFIYFSYMSVLSFGFFILTGTVGFLASLAFVRAIYGSVKID
ncbi:transmembrane 9 family protein [bacterium]|nr:transmembrane 9 family protein [bacterium]